MLMSEIVKINSKYYSKHLVDRKNSIDGNACTNCYFINTKEDYHCELGLQDPKDYKRVGCLDDDDNNYIFKKAKMYIN